MNMRKFEVSQRDFEDDLLDFIQKLRTLPTASWHLRLKTELTGQIKRIR